MEYIVIVWLFVSAHVQKIETTCPNRICVEQIEQGLMKKDMVIKMRVFNKDEAHRVIVSEYPLFPPLIDVYFQ